MRLPDFCSLLSALVCLLGASSVHAQNGPPPPDASPSTPVDIVALPDFEPTREDALLEAFVDGVVEAHRREHDIPGVSVGVVRNGRVMFAKGYGYADIDAGIRTDGDDTLFRIGSVSKTFIWTAVMMLVERGQIDLDTDVNAYLKGVVIPEKFGAPVTMSHLMAHRAGFEDSFGVFTIPREGDISLTDALNKNMPSRVFPPGARTSYSNWGSALAAKIVEDVTGETYNDFLFLEILNPLGMSSTALSDPASMPQALGARLSKGYERKNGDIAEAALMEIGPYAPAGAMSASARDMARWMQLHLGRGSVDGVRLMSPQTYEQMQQRAFDDRPGGADLAHGFFSRTYLGYDSYGHGGATAAFFTYMDLVPELGIGVYVSQNAATDRSLVSHLPNLVIDYLVDDAQVGGRYTDDGAVARAREVESVYFGNRRSFTQFEKIFALTDVTTVSSSDDGALIVSAGDVTKQYFPVRDMHDVYESRHGDRLSFGRDASGRITHYSGAYGVHSSDRIGGLAHPMALAAAVGVVVFFSVTMWAGAWRRQGRSVAQSTTGRILGLADLGVSALVFAFVGCLIAMVGAMSSMGVADLATYPFPVINVFRSIASILVIISFFGVLSLVPGWRSTQWSIWRKAHHTSFVLALGVLAVLLVQWKIVFSATA